MRKIAALVMVLLLPVFALAADIEPGKDDKCPVCGMFVQKYGGWATKIEFNNGAYVYFDGPKDMFKYMLNMKKYKSNHEKSDIKLIFVKEYYNLKAIDGRAAFYVLGSDVYGPMGKELVPFRTEADAKDFMRDHKGKKILRFDAIDEQTLNALY